MRIRLSLCRIATTIRVFTLRTRNLLNRIQKAFRLEASCGLLPPGSVCWNSLLVRRWEEASFAGLRTVFRASRRAESAGLRHRGRSRSGPADPRASSPSASAKTRTGEPFDGRHSTETASNSSICGRRSGGRTWQPLKTEVAKAAAGLESDQAQAVVVQRGAGGEVAEDAAEVAMRTARSWEICSTAAGSWRFHKGRLK